ncbi:unnamed protein product [Lampetra fluviatilis]
MASDTTGSWFPTGFHGHFRSRSRNDMDQTFRLAARPTPPLAFARRLQHPRNGAHTHPFSCHDNRHAGLGSVGYFQTGLGRKRVRTPLALSAGVYNGELVAWAGSAGHEERPLASTYRLDFPGARPPRPASLPPAFTSSSSPFLLLPQLIAPRAALTRLPTAGQSTARSSRFTTLCLPENRGARYTTTAGLAHVAPPPHHPRARLAWPTAWCGRMRHGTTRSSTGCRQQRQQWRWQLRPGPLRDQRLRGL